uniref:Uncharacterized protein n=1 Tax=Physcomitrium patens TaxID=3218 RepID=A0A2K1IJS4_PHYPA|nr:hypothetical protein PHYPA_028216 [Physcomitrium patens]
MEPKSWCFDRHCLLPNRFPMRRIIVVSVSMAGTDDPSRTWFLKGPPTTQDQLLQVDVHDPRQSLVSLGPDP